MVDYQLDELAHRIFQKQSLRQWAGKTKISRVLTKVSLIVQGVAEDAVLIFGNLSRNGQHKGLSEVTRVRDRAARNLTPLDDAGLM